MQLRGSSAGMYLGNENVPFTCRVLAAPDKGPELHSHKRRLKRRLLAAAVVNSAAVRS
jgi:hypothetical protein